jgi:hypothetical protein
MTPTLAAVALAVIAQFLAGQQPFRPSAKVQFQAPQIIEAPQLSKAPRVFQTPLGTYQLPGESATLCTTPILRPSTNVDPKIVVEPPKPHPKIRTIDAGTCIER